MKCMGLKILFILLSAIVLYSCGPGTETASFSSESGFGGGIGGTGGPSVSTGGGIGGTGKTIYGKVTALDDVTVNGITLDTSETDFTFDDVPGTKNDLKVGMVVRVEASVDESGTKGKALRIMYDNELEGPVQDLDLSNRTISSLGQIFLIDDATVFSIPEGFSGLGLGQMLEISGFITPDGIQATWVEQKKGESFIPSKTPVKVKGTLTDLDLSTQTFYVGNQQIDFSKTPYIEPLIANDLKDGLAVEVKGKLDFSNTLRATRIEWKGSVPFGKEGEVLEVEGVITREAADTRFELGYFTVQYLPETVFEHGSREDLVPGAFLEAEGTLDQNLILVSQTISFRHSGILKLKGGVEAVDRSKNTLLLMGTPVHVNNSTRMKDDRDGLQDFDFPDLRLGDHVEIIGSWKNGGLQAIRLVREEFEFYSDLEGNVGRIIPPDFTIQGHLIHTSAVTQFRDGKNTPISQNEFFLGLEGGNQAQVRGMFRGRSMVAARVKLKN